MFKFIKIKDEQNEFDKTNVVVTVPDSDSTISDLCEAFADYLKACGFYLDGKIVDIIPEEPEVATIEPKDDTKKEEIV